MLQHIIPEQPEDFSQSSHRQSEVIKSQVQVKSLPIKHSGEISEQLIEAGAKSVHLFECYSDLEFDPINNLWEDYDLEQCDEYNGAEYGVFELPLYETK